MKVQEQSEKVGLKLNIQNTKIMASGIWQIEGEKVETVTFYFLGLQNHCRWWLPAALKFKRCLLLGRKAVTNPCVFKSLQSCLTLCDPLHCSPSSCVHGILQARILEWAATSSPRGSSWPRNWTHLSYVSYTGRRVLYHQKVLRSPRQT